MNSKRFSRFRKHFSFSDKLLCRTVEFEDKSAAGALDHAVLFLPVVQKLSQMSKVEVKERLCFHPLTFFDYFI